MYATREAQRGGAGGDRTGSGTKKWDKEAGEKRGTTIESLTRAIHWPGQSLFHPLQIHPPKAKKPN
jgi:hypothetical protein